MMLWVIGRSAPRIAAHEGATCDHEPGRLVGASAAFLRSGKPKRSQVGASRLERNEPDASLVHPVP
jgi:hypothetical protein